MMPRSIASGRPAAAILLLVLLALAVAVSASAQTAFSLRSVGRPLPAGDARMAARGGWGLAVVDSSHPGFKNTASLSAVRHVALSFTAYGETAVNRDPTGERRTSHVVSPDLRVALPIVKERLAFTTGFRIHRSTQFTTTLPGTDFAEVWGDSVRGDLLFRREGSRFRVPLGLAWQPRPWLRLSGAVNLENGSMQEELSHEYTDPDRPGSVTSIRIPLYLADIRTERHDFQGASATLGFILEPLDWLRLGGTWTPAHDLDAERSLEHFGVAEDVLNDYTMALPDEYQGGVQLELGRWRLGMDARYQDLGEYRGWNPGFDDLRQERSWSAGVERSRASIRRGGFKNLPLRAGYLRQQWGYAIGGEAVIEQAFSIGTGFPFRGDLGQLDVGLAYGIIGDAAKNELETKYWRLTVSVTGLERWW